MALKQSRKTSKMQEKSSKVECVWETSSSGGLRPSRNKQTCCGGKCNEQFDSKLAESAGTTQTCDLIGGLRSYYAALHKKQKREFIAERVDVGSRPEGDTANLRGKHIFSFHIDDPTSLKRNLADLQGGTIVRLPKPNRDRAMHVCMNFAFFTFGGHSDTLYQDIARKYHGFVTNPAHLSPAEPRVHVSRKARRTERLPPLGVLGFKKDYISMFLKQAARGGCILPNHKVIVLPFNTVQSAHAAYVRFEERRLLVPASESADGPRPNRSLCRYGNRLLGQTEESKAIHPDIAGLSFFRQSWYYDPTLNDIIIRKWMPFAKCQHCKAFKLAEQKEQDPVKRKQIQRAYDAHLCEIELERRCYYSNRIRASLEPEMYCSLIIDGADTKDDQVPHFHERSHATDGIELQKVFVHGCLSHGRGGYVFTMPAHVRQGHNTTVEIIWRVLNDMLDKEGKISPILLLQLDNTCKSNKGTTLFAFLFMLVHFGIVAKIVVSYLPVGHTHEDIDQFFSRFATALRRNDAITREDLERVIFHSCCYNKKPITVVPLQTCFNMKDWLKSQKQCPPTKTKDCMKYRHWRFKKDKDGTVLVQMRTSPIVSYTSEPWQGLEPNSVSHIMFRKGVPNLVHDMQHGLIPPCARREEPLKQAYVDLVLAGIEKLQRILGKLSDADVDSLHALAKSAVAKPLSFSWDPQRVKELFGKGSHGPQIVYPSGGGNYRTLPFQVLVGSFYLVQPSDDIDEAEESTDIQYAYFFIVSRVVLSDRRSTNQEQWLPFLDCRSRLPR